jgi:hypothetical protein
VVPPPNSRLNPGGSQVTSIPEVVASAGAAFGEMTGAGLTDELDVSVELPTAKTTPIAMPAVTATLAATVAPSRRTRISFLVTQELARY